VNLVGFFTTSYSLTPCSLCLSFAQKSQVFSFSLIFPFYNLCHKFSDMPSFFRSQFFTFSIIFHPSVRVFTFPAHSILNYVTPIYCMLCIVSSTICLPLIPLSTYFWIFLIFPLFSSFFFIFLFFFLLLFYFFFLFSFFSSYYIHYVQFYFLHCNY
jgi:hypothetical protein